MDRAETGLALVAMLLKMPHAYRILTRCFRRFRAHDMRHSCLSFTSSITTWKTPSPGVLRQSRKDSREAGVRFRAIATAADGQTIPCVRQPASKLGFLTLIQLYG
jgi:hypothetical protein